MSDHRELAKVMDLFHFEEHSPGMIFWHPIGLKLLRLIEDFMRQIYQDHGFEEVRSPVALNRSLWELSGHWHKFRKNMFIVGSADAEEESDYALKPMSCPAQIAVASVSEKSADWAEMIFRKLKQIGARVELYVSDRTIAKKIRELSARKIPLIAVVGEKEAMNQSLNLRRLGIARQEEIPLAELEVEFCSLHTEANFQLCQH